MSARVRLCCLLVAAMSVGGGATPHAQTLPTLTAPVTDLANVLDTATEAELDRRIRALQVASGDTVVVATVESIAPFGSIEEYAVRLFQHAGIGNRERDNGALLVVAVKDRLVRIEAGYGLEEFITDGFAGETIRQAMLPAFREGQYGTGVLAGTTRIVQRIAERRGVTLKEVPVERPAAPGGGGLPAPVFFIALLILFAVVSRLRRRGSASRFGRRGPWGGWHGGLGGFGGGGFGGLGGFGGGRSGGGFGGFGGGMSGGGGASGKW